MVAISDFFLSQKIMGNNSDISVKNDILSWLNNFQRKLYLKTGKIQKLNIFQVNLDLGVRMHR